MTLGGGAKNLPLHDDPKPKANCVDKKCIATGADNGELEDEDDEAYDPLAEPRAAIEHDRRAEQLTQTA